MDDCVVVVCCLPYILWICSSTAPIAKVPLKWFRFFSIIHRNVWGVHRPIFGNAINSNIGALFQCTLDVWVEVMWGAGVSHTAAQPWAGGAAFLPESWIGQWRAHLQACSILAVHATLSYTHTCLDQSYFFAFSAHLPNRINLRSGRFDRWSDINLIIRVFIKPCIQTYHR